MKKLKFTEQQIAFALQQAEGGTNVAEVCRKMGISETTFYRWKLYGGLMPPEVKKLRQLEEDNAPLRKVVDDRTLDKEMLQERGSGPPHHDIHADCGG
jgi:putative transposase